VITPAEVRAWSDTEADEPLIQIVIDAVEELAVNEFLVTDPPSARTKLGLLMQTSRLLRRRKTPEGVAMFGTEVGFRINKFDPDVELLLSRKALIA
jgi:hypothetical protein